MTLSLQTMVLQLPHPSHANLLAMGYDVVPLVLLGSRVLEAVGTIQFCRVPTYSTGTVYLVSFVRGTPKGAPRERQDLVVLLTCPSL